MIKDNMNHFPPDHIISRTGVGRGFGHLHTYWNIESDIDIEWAVVRLAYTRERLAELGIDEKTLELAYYDNATDEWLHEFFAIGIDNQSLYVWANTSHLSEWAILGGAVLPPSPTTTTIPRSTGGGSGWVQIPATSSINKTTIAITENIGIRAGNIMSVEQDSSRAEIPTGFVVKNRLPFLVLAGLVGLGVAKVVVNVVTKLIYRKGVKERNGFKNR